MGKHPGDNYLNLGEGCDTKRIIQHELLHSSGIHHEQSRPDRDNYVEIHTDCIRDNQHHNFKKQINSKTYNLPYSAESIMHYGAGYFGKDNGKCKTITSKV